MTKVFIKEQKQISHLIWYNEIAKNYFQDFYWYRDIVADSILIYNEFLTICPSSFLTLSIM